MKRIREVAQILIDEIGAEGPEDAEETARRAVAKIQALKSDLENVCDGCDPNAALGMLIDKARALIAAEDACDREAERHPASRSSAPVVRRIKAWEELRKVVGPVEVEADGRPKGIPREGERS